MCGFYPLIHRLIICVAWLVWFLVCFTLVVFVPNTASIFRLNFAWCISKVQRILVIYLSVINFCRDIICWRVALPTDELCRGETDIRLYRALPSSLPLKSVSANYSPPPSGNHHTKTPPSTGALSATPLPGQKNGICMFNLCVQTETYYCKRGEELYAYYHQGPSTTAEHELVKR